MKIMQTSNEYPIRIVTMEEANRYRSLLGKPIFQLPDEGVFWIDSAGVSRWDRTLERAIARNKVYYDSYTSETVAGIDGD